MNSIKQIATARNAQTKRGAQVVVLFTDNSEVWYSLEYLTKKLAAIGGTIGDLTSAPGNYQISSEFAYFAAGSEYTDKAGLPQKRKDARWESSKVQLQLTAAGSVVRQMATMMAASLGLNPTAVVAPQPALTSEPVTEEAEIEIDDEV